MKKNLFYFAVAALALTACSSDEIVSEVAENNGQVAVAFADPYIAGTTRAAVVDNDALKTQGFGVFAYEQGTIAWDTYRSSNVYPNFFYNQKVAFNSTSNAWEYAPIKYFSNNTGAKHSFFVYAPYNASVNAIFSMANNAPVIRYSAKDDYDLLYAAAIIDKAKPGISEKLSFNFKHALSKVSFDVAPFVDEVHGTTHTDGTLADNTTITVRSVKFVGKVPSQGLMNLKDGSWTIEATEEGAYEITNPVSFTSADVNPNQRKSLTSNMMVIPTTAVKIKVVYDVTTVDATNPKNNSTVTNTVESEGTYDLTKGTAYKFHLDLGMTTVKFAADVADWGTESESNVDLPNNLTAATSLSQACSQTSNTVPASPVAGSVYYNTTSAKYMVYNGSWHEVEISGTVSQQAAQSEKWYDATNTTTEVKVYVGKYYMVSGSTDLYIGA